MYCTKCGIENDEDSKFCIKCGNVLSNKPPEYSKANSSIDSSAPSYQKETKKGKINLKNIKIPKTIIIVFGLLIILAVVVSIPNSYNKNDVNNTENLTGYINNTENLIGYINNTENLTGYINNTTTGQDIQDVQNLKNDNTIKVSIYSIPTGANIYIDGIFKGNTPKTISLAEGDYSLKFNMTGYKSIRTDINITSDMARQEVTATLEQIS